MRRLAEFGPATQIHDVWRRFISGMGYPDEITRPLLDPTTARRRCCDGLPARHGPAVPRLHPHDVRAERSSTAARRSTSSPTRSTSRSTSARCRARPRADVRAHARRGARRPRPTRSRSSTSVDDPSTRVADRHAAVGRLARVTQRFYAGVATVPYPHGRRHRRPLLPARRHRPSYGFGLFSRAPVVRGLRHDVPRRRRADRRRVAAPVAELWDPVARDLLGSWSRDFGAFAR